MNKMKSVIISGRPIILQERNKTQLRGITIGESLAYRFFEGVFNNVPLLFAEPKGDTAAPRSLAITAERLSEKFNMPVVYLLPSCPAYERQRLIDKNVYFVVSDKYAHLPMLIANERMRKSKTAKRLSPVAQYLLLYHLQVESLDGMAARDLDGKLPYSYPSITLGITNLEDLGLCRKVADGAKRKVISFNESGKALLEKAQPYFISPVEQRVYCDEFLSDEHFPECGINALAHYTMLNPDPERMIMMSSKLLRSLQKSNALVRPNNFDGNVLIEAWKYPPVTPEGYGAKWVDRLSLAISLREDNDARVEGEVEQMINKLFE